MRLKFKALTLVVSMVLLLCACRQGGDSASDNSINATSVTTVSKTTSSGETSVDYDVISEDLFDQIAKNIKIGDMDISLPCTLDDFGKGFEFDEGLGVVHMKDAGIRGSYLLYKGDKLGYITIKYTDDDKKLNDNEIVGLAFDLSDINEHNDIDYISYGGITFESTKDQVIQQMGKPSRELKLSGGTLNCQYITESNRTISFDFDSREKLIDISIAFV